ncbi:RTR1 RNA polymerase II subunit B1 CTD phosphatase RTR1 [Candida maltosa Xu316]|uniref:RNA polymerase II subunit B1 CTD phosphatase RPAP2 homolog n=1 Tax=Candida maltosa (strain Xu316) TaxID=1245528 RepID=M3J1I0_CANMX|nr:hypothetical protein G210_4079 [Candida maltosa Xu316]
MEELTLESFLPYLEPFNNHELLTPLECSKLSLLVVELLVDHYVDFKLLKFLSRFLTQQSYDELIEERNIEHECGYIMCNQSPKSLVRRLSMNSNGFTQASSIKDPGASTKYQIYNRKPSMILPNTYLSQYCCKEHYQASIFYRNQLSNEAIFSRTEIMTTPPFPINKVNWYENSITCLEEVIAKHKELKQHGKSLSEVIAMMNGLTVGDLENSEMNEETNKLIKLIEDFEIVEKEDPNVNGDLHNEDNEGIPEEDPDDYEEHLHGITNNIEGYVTSNKSFGGYVV